MNKRKRNNYDVQEEIIYVIEYAFGGAGRQDGAQFGPDYLFKDVKYVLEEKKYSVSFISAIPPQVRSPHKDDGLITSTEKEEMAMENSLDLSEKTIEKYSLDTETNQLVTYLVEYDKEGKVKSVKEHKRISFIDEEATKNENKTVLKKLPPGIKNLEYVVSAVEYLASYVAKTLLKSHFEKTSNIVPPLVIGGDHTQGLGTAIGTRIVEIFKALCSGELQIALPSSSSKDEILSPIIKSAEQLYQSLDSDFKKVRENMRLFISSIDKLIDRKFFNEICIQRKSGEKISMMSEDTGLLKISSLEAFLKTIHIIWFDAHGDWNTDVTSDTKNAHGMPLAAICGYGFLSNIFDCAWMSLDPKNTHTIGTRDTDVAERALMQQLGVNVYRMGHVQKAGQEVGDNSLALKYLFEKILSQISHDVFSKTGKKARIIFSYDGDGINATDFPSTGTPVLRGGSSGEKACDAVRGLFKRTDLNIEVLIHEFSEFNPLLRTDPITKQENPESVMITQETAVKFISSIYDSPSPLKRQRTKSFLNFINKPVSSFLQLFRKKERVINLHYY